MIFRSALLLTGFALALPAIPQTLEAPPETQAVSFEELSPEDQIEAAADALAPLLDRIADVEGGPSALNAVNRGYAGDTPGGSRSVLGRDLTEMTVAEVMAAQRGSVYAVGAFQFIPKTLRALVKRSNYDASRRFTQATQQELAVLLIKHHRPHVWAYVTSCEYSLRYLAGVGMAREWASVGHPSTGRSVYAGIGGNRAKVSPQYVTRSLRDACGTLTQPILI